MKSEENPVNAETARELLGLPGKPWPRSRLTAIKKAMGITSRFFFVSDVRDFLRKNKDFKVDQWKRKTANDGDSGMSDKLNNARVSAKLAAGAHSSAFSEPSPQMDVNDPRWPDAFTAWATRKAASMGMDPIEMMGRALGLNKEADGWRKRRQAELRHREQHSNDIYGKTQNDV